jgi:hypothetical protein
LHGYCGKELLEREGLFPYSPIIACLLATLAAVKRLLGLLERKGVDRISGSLEGKVRKVVVAPPEFFIRLHCVYPVPPAFTYLPEERKLWLIR